MQDGEAFVNNLLLRSIAKSCTLVSMPKDKQSKQYQSSPTVHHSEVKRPSHRGVTSSQLPSRHLFLIMPSSVIAISGVGGGATRVARSTSTVASRRLGAVVAWQYGEKVGRVMESASTRWIKDPARHLIYSLIASRKPFKPRRGNPELVCSLGGTQQHTRTYSIIFSNG